MTVSISGTNGVTFPDSSLQAAAASPYVLKNRIINGDMRIDQRNAGASGTGNNNYTVDRWGYYATQASKLTWQQNAGSVTPPAGFTNYLGVTSSSSYSSAASDIFEIYQVIEGFNWSDLAFGTANAKTVTLSFWVRSSLTGTFGGSLQNYAGTRSYPFSYTISSANTWTQISVTISGDTSGTWVGSSNAGSAQVNFSLGSGSTYQGTSGAWAGANYNSATGATSVVGTNGATFYITGVQLEIGSSATPFERRMYGNELALCQRYCVKFGPNNGEFFGYAYQTNSSVINFIFPVTMRTDPSLTYTATWTGFSATNSTSTATLTANVQSPLNASVVSAFTATSGTPTRISSGSSGSVVFSSEL